AFLERDAAPGSASRAATIQPSSIARGILESAGIPLVSERFCTDNAQASEAARAFGYPVVAKLASDAITHKSEVGGVIVGIGSEPELIEAARRLLAIPGAQGVVIQPQLSGLELIVGARRDPDFGPVVTIGLGGIYVEIL